MRYIYIPDAMDRFNPPLNAPTSGSVVFDEGRSALYGRRFVITMDDKIALVLESSLFKA